MNSSLIAMINGPETPLNTAKSTDYYPGTEGDSELLQIQDTLLDGLRTLAKSTRRRATVLKDLLPEYDRAQKRFSRHRKSHVTLPKGCTWTKIKLWMIESAGLEMSLRQLERELEELRNPGRKAKKNATTARRKQENDELIKLANGIVKAYRTGNDVSAAIEAYEHEQSRQNAPTDDLEPVSAGVTATEAEPKPEGTGTAMVQCREIALVPVTMTDQFDSTSSPEACARSARGSTVVVMADTTVVTTRAALEPTTARSERRRKTTSCDRGGVNIQTVPTAQKPRPDPTAISRSEPGGEASHAEAVTVREMEPVPTSEAPKSKTTRGSCVPIDSRRHAGGIAADVKATVNPANPKSTASELAGSVNEAIECVCLEPVPGGGYKVVPARAGLNRIRKARKGGKHLLSGPVDLFDLAVSFDVIRDVLSSVRGAQESDFWVSTAHPEHMHEYAQWEKSQYDLWHFPINLTLWVQVQSSLDLHRLDHFAEVYHELKSVSFVGFKSDSARPLTPGDLLRRLIKCEPREILIETSSARGAQDLARADAECLALIAGQRALASTSFLSEVVAPAFTHAATVLP